MSEHVMIGGIGKSPAIDKIHRFSSKGLKQTIVKKMEEQMLIKYTDSLKKYTDRIPIKFKKANWKGTLYRNKEERYALAKNALPKWKDFLAYTEKLERDRRGRDWKNFSLLSKAPESFPWFRGESYFYEKPLRQVPKGEANISLKIESKKTYQLDMLKKHSGLIHKKENKKREGGILFLPYKGKSQ